MTAQDFQYLKEKALKVIASCKTEQQKENAKRYMELFNKMYVNNFL
jgi:predicted GNAT family acetyltransferase